MRPSDAVMSFGEWLPDLPDLGNPGLIEARNVRPIDRTYKSFAPLVSRGGSGLPSTPIGAIRASDPFLGSYVVAAAGDRRIYAASGFVATLTAISATLPANVDVCGFAQYDRTVIIAHPGATAPLRWTLGAVSTATLSATDAVRSASVVGVINQFVMLGNLDALAAPSTVQWCAIGGPTNWPTPGSATAVATQAGEQVLPAALGSVMGIFGSDQAGVIFQEGGIHRVSYLGGNAVFQFDKLSENIGMPFYHGAVQVGRVVYFPSRSGFFKTDGYQVVPIGAGKVDRWFLEQLYGINIPYVWGSYDARNNLIYWAFPVGSTVPSRILIYNILEDRFSYALQNIDALVPAVSHDVYAFGLEGFTTANAVGTFSDTPGTAVIITGEREHNPGGFSLIDGIKPLVSGTATAITVAIGTRNTQDPSALTYTSETTATAVTGFADFRSSARYHRERITITGAFDKAIGVLRKLFTQGMR